MYRKTEPKTAVTKEQIKSLGFKIASSPEGHSSFKQRPKLVLDYLESLIPDEQMRNYVLSFIKTKITTLEYSPVVLQFHGPGNQNSDLLFNMLNNILGEGSEEEFADCISDNTLLNPYNEWILDNLFTLLDNFKDNGKINKALRAISSKEDIVVHTSYGQFNYKHNTTFMLIDTFDTPQVEKGDNSVAVINTPNEFEHWDFREIMNPGEYLRFCHYLATEVKSLSAEDYAAVPQHLVYKGA